MYPKQAKQSMDQAVERFAPMVQRIAFNMSTSLPANVDLQDLIQAGLMGVMDAHKTFNPSLGIPLEAYVSKKIRWAITDEMRKQDWLPKTMRTKRKKLDEAVRSATQKSESGKASEEDIANELGLDADEYRRLCTEVENISFFSIDDAEDPDSRSFLDRYIDDSTPTPMDATSENQIRSRIVQGISELPEREALVLSLHYEEDLTYREIAEILEISIPRAHQLHSQAVARLKTLFQ